MTTLTPSCLGRDLPVNEQLTPPEQNLAEHMAQMCSAAEQLCRSNKNRHLPHLSMESLLIEHGELFAKPTRTFPLLGEMKACFENAAHIALRHCDFIYVEGLALYPGLSLPVHHAWLVTSDGQAYDPTWETPGEVYFGIPFETDYIREAVLVHGCYGLLDEEVGIADLVAGLQQSFKAMVTTAPQSERLRTTAKALQGRYLSEGTPRC